ncbi:MAG: hypothetical protein J0H01_12570 [Rhizobiales bacterium]|nr:hypothetical protein [Hyphomicrobiales bacterium]
MSSHSLMPRLASRPMRASSAALLIGASLLLSGCAGVNWQATGERWVDSACRQSGNCRPTCDDAGALSGVCRGAPRGR